MPYLVRNTNTGKPQLVWNRRDVKRYERLPHYIVEGECDRLGRLTDDRPAVNDRKAAWVDYAVAQGADRDDAEALTKDDLVDQYGA